MRIDETEDLANAPEIHPSMGYGTPAEPDEPTESGEESYTHLVNRFHGDFSLSLCGPNTHFVAQEIFDWFEENALLRNGTPHRAHHESQWRTLAAKLMKSLNYLSADTKMKSAVTFRVTMYSVLHAWDLPEFDAINGNLNMAEFAKTIVVKYVKIGTKKKPVYLTKAAVNFAVLAAQKHLQLPPRRDQRPQESRDKMSEARNEQLKPNASQQ